MFIKLQGSFETKTRSLTSIPHYQVRKSLLRKSPRWNRVLFSQASWRPPEGWCDKRPCYVWNFLGERILALAGLRRKDHKDCPNTYKVEGKGSHYKFTAQWIIKPTMGGASDLPLFSWRLLRNARDFYYKKQKISSENSNLTSPRTKPTVFYPRPAAGFPSPAREKKNLLFLL